MINICLTKQNKKLNRNLLYYTDESKRIFEYSFDQGIYKYYFAINQNIDVMIINASVLSPEIDSFISDFNNKIRFVIYNDTDSPGLSVKYKNMISKFLVHTNPESINDIILSKYIVNEKIYNNIEVPAKTNQYVYFLDNNDTIPIQLEQILYPNSSAVIKMFNGYKINHHQNLGHITEEIRKDILLESSDYLYSNDDYNMEAKLCGCNLIDVDKDNINLNDISTINDDYSTYGDLIKAII